MNITVQQSSHLQINQFVEEATKTGSLLSTPKRLLNQESWRFWSCPVSTPIGTCWLSFLMGKPSQKTFPRDLKVWTLQVSEPMPMSRPLELTSSSTNLKLKFKRDFKEQIEQLGVRDLKQMLSIWFFPISSSLSTTSSSILTTLFADKVVDRTMQEFSQVELLAVRSQELQVFGCPQPPCCCGRVRCCQRF